MQQGPTSDDAKLKNHYHWRDLCNSLSIRHITASTTNWHRRWVEHGTPQEIVNVQKSQDKLGNRLIGTNIFWRSVTKYWWRSRAEALSIWSSHSRYRNRGFPSRSTNHVLAQPTIENLQNIEIWCTQDRYKLLGTDVWRVFNDPGSWERFMGSWQVRLRTWITNYIPGSTKHMIWH